MKSRKRKAVLLEWVDSTSRSPTWCDNDVAYDEGLLRTLGFVVAETKSTLTVAAHVGESLGLHSGGLAIPKCAIVRRRTVRL